MVPDSLGYYCRIVQNKYMVEIFILQPMNNFLFRTKDYKFYKWSSKIKKK